MKWVIFSGSWRFTNKAVEEDVRNAVRKVLARGDGVLTGGATGVDYFAMNEAMKIYCDASRLMVVIPAYLKDYLNDYYTNWCHDPIKKTDVDALAEVLTKIKKLNPSNLIEMPNKIISQEHYDLRSEQEVLLGDEIYAFQVNESTGTQKTIDFAVKKGLPISVHKKYSI